MVQGYEIVIFLAGIGVGAFFLYIVLQRVSWRTPDEKEGWYRRLFEAGNDTILVHAIEADGSPGRIMEVNDVACRRMGYTREEFLQLRPADLDDPESTLDTSEVMDHLARDGRVVFDRIHITKSGDKIPVEVSTQLVDMSGQTAAISIIRDISRRVETERKLRDIQEIDEKILDGSPVAFVLHDKNMRVVRVSRAYQDVTGFMPDHVVGRTLEEFMPDGPQKQRIIGNLMKVQEYGVQVGPKDIESPIPGRHLRETILPVFGEKRNVTNTLSVLEDITDRKIAMDALAQSEERYRMLFDSISDGVVIHEIHENGMPGSFVEVNRGFCNTIGYRRNELLKMSPLDLENPEETEDTSGIQETLQMGGGTFFERKLVSKDGDLIPVEISAQTFQLGAQYLGLSVVRDISERQAAKELITASLAEKEILLREIHHRVKNNLQVISGLLNLQSRYIDDEGVRSIYKESQNRIKTMALIHEGFYQHDDLAHINLVEYIRNLTENLFASYMVKKGAIDLILDIPDIEMNLDTAIPCGLIVNELISNSMKHAFPGERTGKIGVSMAEQGEGYSLTVSDDGVGFPEGVDFRKVKSMGMQLVTVLAEQLGGEVRYSGESGTSFTVTFKEYHEVGTEVH
jgi:PAS domain S-box-containing protein